MDFVANARQLNRLGYTLSTQGPRLTIGLRRLMTTGHLEDVLTVLGILAPRHTYDLLPELITSCTTTPYTPTICPLLGRLPHGYAALHIPHLIGHARATADPAAQTALTTIITYLGLDPTPGPGRSPQTQPEDHTDPPDQATPSPTVIEAAHQITSITTTMHEEPDLVEQLTTFYTTHGLWL